MEFVENRIGDEPVYHCVDPAVFTVDNLLTDEELLDRLKTTPRNKSMKSACR